MAITTTYLNGAISAASSGALQQITLNAYTAPTVGPVGPKPMLVFTTGERCLIVDSTLSPTLTVVRGWDGSPSQAHKLYEGVQYGLPNDFTLASLFPLGQVILSTPWAAQGAQEVTATGATGTTAAVVTASFPGFLNCTGASGTGVNLPYPTVGMEYTIRNNGTGALNVYSVGAKINGTTGTTAYVISATGDLGANFNCSTAGAWQVAPQAT